MANSNENGAEAVYIPPNFKEGTSVFGFMIKPLYAIQAVPFILIICLIVFGALFFLPLKVKIVAALILSALAFFVAITGINGDSIFGFIANVIKTKRQPKTYIYNPRVKTEIKPYHLDPGSMNALPREKLLAFIEKIRKEKDIEDEEDDEDVEYFFKDDIGYVEKPERYMSKKELNRYRQTGKSAPTIGSGHITYRRKR